MNAINRFLWKKRIQFWQQKIDKAKRMEILLPWLIQERDAAQVAYEKEKQGTSR